MFAFSLIPAVLLASTVAAVPYPSSIFDHATSHLLYIRQSLPTIPVSELPEQCKTDCLILSNLPQLCPVITPACVCTDQIGNALVQCSTCVVGLPGVPVNTGSKLQSSLDDISSTCATDGHPFSKPLKIGGSSTGNPGPPSPLASSGAASGLPPPSASSLPSQSNSPGGSSSSSSAPPAGISSSSLSLSPNGAIWLWSIVGGLFLVGI